MASPNSVWIKDANLGSADMARTAREHLALLRSQLRVTGKRLDASRSCIDESWDLITKLNGRRRGE